jgi:hypothetical protein
MGEMRNVYKTLVGSLKGKDHSEDFGIDGSVILKCKRNKDWIHLADSCEHGNDPSCSIKREIT